ncbi:hypothetical protein CO165_04405 [Candidatus Roizmanbacteria bacterium CG_4_9_14_3_um_filter_33_18]|uniref:Uncharacterized protein n=3 Tax=Candidatus Roizmaniibacteriota TaxID=1752723 RepID=A0A2M7U895_9BACT|nr:MAG: hypothetical protein COW97_00465 [Candidatus Roizmanbacteria bacterium CG22_combo_CG10-13_8_21_14_all_34_12]PIZ67457.1 MAG: hypothetical protein COY12_01910 [Candidatus Roizmanbacteria bacterium CG_4_10_14_0_2_um_filter_33_96]PJA55283.1 MAG: hypothetical protein CO165_04405 [Candidatus Roizmanbacteria bacterium CG_4_9_14_3_um_filter_33_18]
MKKILRMIIFSGVAIFLTALWNKGFVIKQDPMIYLKTALLIAAVYYLVLPISKLILLPLNIISLGLVSVIFYSVVLFFLFDRFNLITVKEWTFSGLKFFSLVVNEMKISRTLNIFISSFSISTIINLLEKII